MRAWHLGALAFAAVFLSGGSLDRGSLHRGSLVDGALHTGSIGSPLEGGMIPGLQWLRDNARVYYDAEQGASHSDGVAESLENFGSDGAAADCTGHAAGVIWNAGSPASWTFAGTGDQGCSKNWTATEDFAQPYTACARLSNTGSGIDSLFDSFGASSNRSSIRTDAGNEWNCWASTGGTYLDSGEAVTGSLENVCCVFDGASSEVFVGGVSRATGTLGADGLQGVSVGYTYTKGADWQGSMVGLYFLDGDVGSTAAAHMQTAYP